jgi:hypothetical protein
MAERRPLEADRSWEAATWEGARRQLREAVQAATTPAQRLAWLEEMLGIAHRAGALERRFTQDE